MDQSFTFVASLLVGTRTGAHSAEIVSGRALFIALLALGLGLTLKRLRATCPIE